MKVRILFWFTATAILISACIPSTSALGTNTPSNRPSKAAPINSLDTPTLIPVSPTAEPPTLTPTPNATATASFTPTPSGPRVLILANATNCMYGPDFGYQIVDILDTGQVGQIIGRDDNMNWLQILDPHNASVSCWVSAGSVTTTGDVTSAQVVMPPMGTISKASISASAKSGVCPGQNRIHFTATVTTTSWVILDYYWVVTGAAEANIPGGRTVFKTGGAHGLAGNFQGNLPCGVYKVTLRITNPQTVSVTKTLAIP